jgi:predicted nuclease of predicted toxin-antitoxin system
VKRSSPPKRKFLLDANLSKKIVASLTKLTGYDFTHISTYSSDSLSDSQIIEIAKKHNRIIVTHDLDYGEIYYLKERGQIGVIMLRLSDQTSSNVINKLKSFFSSSDCRKTNLSTSLIIISDEHTRIFSP